MDRKILIWLIILLALIATLGYLMTQKTTVTTTTTMPSDITTTGLQSTTTRLITRPTQPTTTLQGATTILQTTTTAPPGASTTTLSATTNATASTTTTTHPDTPDATTTTSTTIAGATTTTTQAGATTTTQQGTTTTTQTGATTTTIAATTTTQTGATTTTTLGTTTTQTGATTTTTLPSTSTTTTTTTATTTTTTLAQLSAPKLYLKFDESVGTTAYDSSGNYNNGNLVNGPTWTAGKSGNALSFDGTDDYVNLGEILDSYNSITIMAWIKPAASRQQVIVCKDWQTSNTGYEFGVTPGGELRFRINPTASSYAYRTSSGATIAANVWQHVAVTYDGTSIKFYKNGALVSTVAAGGRLYSSTEVVYVGVYETLGTFQYSGQIDELKVYDKSLSAAEINQIYSTAPSGTTPTTSTTTTTAAGATTTKTTTTSATTRTTTTTTTTRTTTRATTTTTLSGTECYGAEDCNPTGNPIGGGSGYSRIITSGTVTVTNKAQLLSALQGASSGTVIFIPSGTTIDMTGTASVTIPGGVTLASNRGSGGASGALIKRTENLNGGWEEPMFIAGGNNVRVTGLILEGEMYPQDYGNGEVYPGSIYEQYYLVGIYANGRSGFEVDNCELRGWAWSAISIRQCTNAYIHHNYIHHCQARGEGYGTNLYGGSALIEANIYDYNRHDITGAGMEGEQYEARYNLGLGHGNAIGAVNYDVHADEETGTGLAGYKFLIHHNTVEGGVIAFGHIRADVEVGAYFYNNVINSEGSDTGTVDDMPIWQSGGSEGMFVTNNYWKGTFYPTGDGISYSTG